MNSHCYWCAKKQQSSLYRLGATNPSVLVNFKGLQLPHVVHMGLLRVTVMSYTDQVLLGGHKADNCPNKTRCGRCGEQNMVETNCLVETPRRYNCGGEHDAMPSKCRIRVMETVITRKREANPQRSRAATRHQATSERRKIRRLTDRSANNGHVP